MVSSIVGNYLVDKGLITKAQLVDLLNEQQKVRVKLGLIAVAEGLMSQEEADKVNRLQAVQDKRFGDIAIENGILTEEQVASLLKKQGNAYLAFAQALEELQLMSIEQLEQCLVDFMWEREMTQSGMADLKSDDADRILALFIPPEGKEYEPLAATAVRTIMRLVDSEVYPGKAYITDYESIETIASQFVEGDTSIVCSLAGDGDALLPVACTFGKEAFDTVDADALDAVAELINCINGLYASELSRKGIVMELYPPEYSADIKEIEAKEMMVLPLYIKGKTCKLIISFSDNAVTE